MNPENAPLSSETTPSTSQNKKSKVLSIIKEIIVFAIIAFGIVLPFRMYVAEPYLVDGRSMDPTFATGDYLIVNKFSYRTGKPERNSVLVFKYPNNPKKSFIKRVIGLPGETYETARKTIEFAEEMRNKGLTNADFYSLSPFPGSEIWKNPEKYNIKILSKNFDNYLQKGNPVIETEYLPIKKIEELLKEARTRWKK